MKRILKILLLLLFSFAFYFSVIIINAADDDDSLSPESQEALAKQKENIEKYCDENQALNGCIFDSSDSLYMKSTKYTFYDDIPEPGMENIYHSFTFPKDISLTRGYQTFDGKGNAIFAGCYRYVKTDNKNGEAGTYFLFQIISKSGNKCKVVNRELVPASDVSGWSGKIPFNFLVYKMATYNDWVAISNGDCPKVFGYTANSKWYTIDSNKYIFSNGVDDFNIKTYSFFTGEQYKGRPGCTVEDVDGKEKAQQLLNEVLNEINNKACPAKIEDMNSFSDEFENWYENLRTSNEYRVLWSSGLIDEVTHESVEVQINEAIHKKTTDCQYKICNISTSKRSVIESNLGSECRNGCTLSNVKAPSDSPNAKCYCCGGSQGCIYQWTEEGGSTCGLQNNVSKDQCIGTSKDLECRKCLVNAYNKANLTDEEKSCMAGSEIAKLLTERNLEESNNEAASADKEREIEENRTIREEIYERLGFGKIPFSYDFNISNENLTCKEILGDNLVKIVKTSILIVQIVAAIIAIVKAMIVLIPPIIAKDADALKKSQSTLITMAIILVIIFTFRPIVKLIGSMLNFDISCIL